ncbi:NADP-specific glutamate dehydrogenase [Acidaminobacter hydrogenoformans]|uniref:Glutamate dehydrogenase n=1 Tax=Acidaminobacter hydrogenoformans DSM 2784 TaxID=1120920 RepID=A0A1G5S1R2_9FIRM|nr:NADP-specific glutamate dehydrogenase [Acidaminobacter hydrogenoformans]SCZ79671.1 glutamate dehydrogenase (NADP+) [Acidaminobacter hydrogenoformans DSM 2784]
MNYLEKTLANVKKRNAHEPEYIQAVEEVFMSIAPVLEQRPDYVEANILERMTEPERTIIFRVPWVNDKGELVVNRGFRIQFNGARGPYKGGLRFHPTVNLSILKFLGFEQTFKNTLTGRPIGGGKGGSDFDPKGKSDKEIMRFCQSFMTELYRHIGPDVDVPAGDIGVGSREIGFLYGQYKRIRGAYEGGVLTGKHIEYGGSYVRTEATGYGLLYLTKAMFDHHNIPLAGKVAVISGSGNVALYAAQKAIELGLKVVAMSDSSGYVYDAQGIDLPYMIDLKEVKKGRISEYIKTHPHAQYVEGWENIWNVKCDVAFPCATQNDITLEKAEKLVANGVIAVAEGANMPTTNEALEYLKKNGVLITPAKASNAGGVAISSVEMTQNSMRQSLTFEEVDNILKDIMDTIHKDCVEAAAQYGFGYDLVAGANISSFMKVADAMLLQGDY